MFEIIIINLVFTVIAFMFIWSKVQLSLSTQNKIDLETKKREAFKNLLVLHSDLILGKQFGNDIPIKWLEKFSDMTINILLWGSDKVIFEYGEYAMMKYKPTVKTEEREIHFANAVLAFRKEIGYKNRFKRVTPEHIIRLFKIGYEDKVI